MHALCTVGHNSNEEGHAPDVSYYDNVVLVQLTTTTANRRQGKWVLLMHLHVNLIQVTATVTATVSVKNSDRKSL